MRPTDLKFRHPSEKTPDPYNPCVTTTGGALFHKRLRNKSSLPTAKRFVDIGGDKTSFWRGPGSYDLSYQSIGKRKLRGVPVYRPFHGDKEMKTNSYFYIGNCLVCDPSISLMGKNKAGEVIKVNNNIYKTRCTTASSRNYSPGLKKYSPNTLDESTNRPSSALDNRF